MKLSNSLFASITCTIAVSAFTVISAFAAPPTAEDDAKIVGNWKVTPPGLERIYEISAGHNIKMIGGSVQDKSGRLTPRNDGSYTINLQGGAVQRVVYVKADDQLLIEYFDNKKSMELNLVRWKSAGIRTAVGK